MDTDETDLMEEAEAVEADRREEVEAVEAVEAAACAVEETTECDECNSETPVRQMTMTTRGLLVCSSCATSRASRLFSSFHIRDPTTATKTTKMKKKNGTRR